MITNTKRGYFITVEGGEGAGKTTLIDALTAEFQKNKISFTRTREPGGSRLGEGVRTLLLQNKGVVIDDRAELLLFLASRAQHVQELIRPALVDGQVVLCDRFNDSTIAYQGIARGLGVQTVQQLCSFSTGGLSPDLTFYLDIDPKVGIQRIKKASERGGITDRIEAETLDFHRKVREGFLKLAAEDSLRFQVLDATQSKEALFNQAWEIILMRTNLIEND